MQNKAASNWLTLSDDITKEHADRIIKCYGEVIQQNPDAWLRRLPKSLKREIIELLLKRPVRRFKRF